ASVATTAYALVSRSATATPPSVDNRSAGTAGSSRSTDQRTAGLSPAAATDSTPPCDSTPTVGTRHVPTSPDLDPASTTAGDRSGISFSPRELLQRVDRERLLCDELFQSCVLALEVLQPTSVGHFH